MEFFAQLFGSIFGAMLAFVLIGGVAFSVVFVMIPRAIHNALQRRKARKGKARASV